MIPAEDITNNLAISWYAKIAEISSTWIGLRWKREGVTLGQFLQRIRM